jgi:diguanylate cyclase (GGDEF)-like protein
MADATREVLRDMREARAATADALVRDLASEAYMLVYWAMAALVIALVIIGPLGLLLLGDAARRLRDVWRAMRRITSSGTSGPVPSLLDADEVGEMARAVQVFKDNALALARHRGEVEQVNRWLDIALNNMARGISMFDAEQKLVLCNDMYRTMYGLPVELAQRGTPAIDILAHRKGRITRVEYDEPDTTPGATVTTGLDRQSLPRTLPVDGEDTRAPLDHFISDGQMFSIYQYLDDGRIIALANKRLVDGSWVAVHEDVTRHRQAEARIAVLAQTDALTALANRRAFRDDLDLRCAAPNGPKDFAILLIDLDEFKPVNDTYGHLTGDALLFQVAQRLKGLIRDCDLVARVGGDEFAIIEDGASTVAEAAALATRIVTALSQPFLVDQHTVSIGASIGIALAPEHGADARELLSHADLALYHSKQTGRSRYTVFEAVLETEADVRRALEVDLRAALDRGQLELHYQPIVDAATAAVVVFEALLRWRHPTRGMIPPMSFIPFAEQSGLIVQIGAWALKQACRDAATWPAHICVSVNLSAVQVHAGGIVETVAMTLAETGLAARRLELEVTETLQLGDQPCAREQLLKLRSLGVRIALDDFGTGYASLSYLRRFPFDKLKIDRMFIADIADSASLAIVEAVTALARSLDMVTVAEGIETGEHLDRARAAGCVQLQGYLFSKPVPADEVLVIIQRQDQQQERAA